MLKTAKAHGDGFRGPGVQSRPWTVPGPEPAVMDARED
jgi:hypothetical protein